MRRGRPSRLMFVLLGVLSLPPLLWLRLQIDDSALSGATLGGEPVPARDGLKQALQARAQRWSEASVTLHAGPYLSRRTRASLGASLPLEEAVARVASLGRSGNPLRDLAAYWAASRGALDLPWAPHVDREALAGALRAIREQVERAPVPGTFDASGEVIDGIPGLTINSVSALARLERVLRRDELEVELEVTRIKPPEPVRYEQMTAGLFTHVLHGFETRYSQSSAKWGRARNIEVAVRAIDQVVLLPGEVLSFNDTVGERNFERGFRAAKELQNRRVVEGIGGGVCQVAATLHAAAFLGGMEIPVYQPHSRPVSYIELGLDTMVSWPDRDLHVRNPYPFPVRIQATAGQGVVRVELVGAGKPHPVEWDKHILERIDAGEQQVVDPEVAAGEREILQRPIDGLVVERRRTIYLPTGPQTSVDTLRYPPNPRIVAVGG